MTDTPAGWPEFAALVRARLEKGAQDFNRPPAELAEARPRP